MSSFEITTYAASCRDCHIARVDYVLIQERGVGYMLIGRDDHSTGKNQKGSN